MDKIKLGDYNRLQIVKRVDFGLYLDGGAEGEILLPNRYVPEGVNIGDEIEVFLYLDIDERLVATTEKPLAKVGEFAFLEVAWVNEYGAFLKWGLMKDLFCPFREQKRRMEIGEKYIVHVHIDEESYRIVASAKVEHYIDTTRHPELTRGEKVELLVWQKSPIGFKLIVNNRYAGLAYDDQVFRYVHQGDRCEGYVSNIRPDGKIDITLQPTGRQQTLDFADTLLDYLRSHGGVCPFGDKTDAETIKHTCHVSKKVFKRAAGDLYKRRLVTLDDERIALLDDNAEA